MLYRLLSFPSEEASLARMRCMAKTGIDGIAPDSSCSDNDAQSVEQHAYDSCMAVICDERESGMRSPRRKQRFNRYVPGCDVVGRKSAGFWLSPESGRSGCQQREGHRSGRMEQVSKAEA
jgi:hypothetical protein